MDEEFIAIGIDLGTTTTVLSYSINGQIPQNPKEIPSALAINCGNQIVVGEEALEAIKDDPTCGVVQSKRLIGRSFEDPVVQAEVKKGENGQGPRIVPGKDIPNRSGEFFYKLPNEQAFSPIDIASEVLKAIVKVSNRHEDIENDLKKPDDQRRVSIVITVPAYFTLPQMAATDIAAEKAGLKKNGRDPMYRHVNEPNAGTIFYLTNIYQKKEELITDLRKKILNPNSSEEDKERYSQVITNLSKKEVFMVVFDFGGGTLDVSVQRVLEENDGRISCSVLSSHGNRELGGSDIDQAFSLEIHKVLTSQGIAIDYHQNQKKLLSIAEKAKKFLSTEYEYPIPIKTFLNGNKGILRIKREHLINAIENDPKIKWDHLLDDCLKWAKITRFQISHIIPIGGSSIIPYVQEKLLGYFKFGVLPSVIFDNSVKLNAVSQGAMLYSLLFFKKTFKERFDSGKLPGHQREYNLRCFKTLDVIQNIEYHEITQDKYSIECFGDLAFQVFAKGIPVPASTNYDFSKTFDDQESIRFTVLQGMSPWAFENMPIATEILHIPVSEKGNNAFKATLEIDEQYNLKYVLQTSQQQISKLIWYTSSSKEIGSYPGIVDRNKYSDLDVSKIESMQRPYSSLLLLVLRTEDRLNKQYKVIFDTQTQNWIFGQIKDLKEFLEELKKKPIREVTPLIGREIAEKYKSFHDFVKEKAGRFFINDDDLRRSFSQFDIGI